MQLKLFRDKVSLGQAAAEQAASAIRRAIAERGARTDHRCHGSIAIRVPRCSSRRLRALIGPGWRAFHLDEYIGLPVTHPASFRKFLHGAVGE